MSSTGSCPRSRRPVFSVPPDNAFGRRLAWQGRLRAQAAMTWLWPSNSRPGTFGAADSCMRSHAEGLLSIPWQRGSRTTRKRPRWSCRHLFEQWQLLCQTSRINKPPRSLPRRAQTGVLPRISAPQRCCQTRLSGQDRAGRPLPNQATSCRRTGAPDRRPRSSRPLRRALPRTPQRGPLGARWRPPNASTTRRTVPDPMPNVVAFHCPVPPRRRTCLRIGAPPTSSGKAQGRAWTAVREECRLPRPAADRGNRRLTAIPWPAWRPPDGTLCCLPRGSLQETMWLPFPLSRAMRE
eukprot:jgi/Botrbrau1/16997/Bobra.49_2s0056.1